MAVYQGKLAATKGADLKELFDGWYERVSGELGGRVSKEKLYQMAEGGYRLGMRRKSNPVAPRVQRSIDAASRWAELAAYSEHDAGRKYASVQKHFSDWARMSGNAAALEHFTAGERQRVKLAFAKAYAAEEKAAAGKQASNPYRDQAYGNEFEKRGKAWYGRFSFRSPLYEKGKDTGEFTGWRKLTKEEVGILERMIGKGKVIESNPAKSAAQYRLAQAVIGGTSTSSMPVAVAREIVKRNPPQTKYTVPELRALFYRLGYGMGKGDSASAAVGVDIKGDLEANFRFNLDKIIEYYQPVSEEQIVNLRGVFQVGYGHGYSGRPSVEKQFKSGKKKNPSKRTRKNPMDDADAMFESFHGAPPQETVEFIDELHQHHNLAGLGDLIGLKVRTVSGLDATLEFDGVLLCSNEAGTHLFLMGGDQELDLECLDIDNSSEKESVVVGEVWALAYETSKEFDGFEPIQYVHILGKERLNTKLPKSADLWEEAEPPKEAAFECGQLPSLRYSTVDSLLHLDGGIYKIEKPLVGVSPGIEQ